MLQEGEEKLTLPHQILIEKDKMEEGIHLGCNPPQNYDTHKGRPPPDFPTPVERIIEKQRGRQFQGFPVRRGVEPERMIGDVLDYRGQVVRVPVRDLDGLERG